MYATSGTRGAAVAALVAVVSLGAWTTLPDQMVLQPESRLWVEGSSTMKSWKCDAPGVDVSVDANPAAALGVLANEHAVKSVKLIVTTAMMDCSNGTMNDHMRKALKASAYPTIVFSLDSYDLAKAADTVQVTLKGDLVLGSEKKPITVMAAATAGPDGALRIAGTYELNMKDYGLTPPSLMFGTMKVGAVVKVRFDLLLKS